MSLHIQTPLIESQLLSLKSGCSIFLKLETMQPPGSFKIRGMGAACEEYLRRGARSFISSSGGNAGIAVAYAGRCLSVPVTVVVPESTSVRAIELIKQEDAKVVVHGATWQEANELAQSMVSETDAFLHPFDDPLLWQGHATLIDEIAVSGMKPDAIVLSVGGGGLLSGVVEGLHRNNWRDVNILAVETEGASSLSRSVQAGQRVELDNITSIATSLGAKKVCHQAYNLVREHPVRSVVVTDRAAIKACNSFLDDHRVLVEPACGAALALAYDCMPELTEFKTVVMIVCGGATATVTQLQEWSNPGKRENKPG